MSPYDSSAVIFQLTTILATCPLVVWQDGGADECKQEAMADEGGGGDNNINNNMGNQLQLLPGKAFGNSFQIYFVFPSDTTALLNASAVNVSL